MKVSKAQKKEIRRRLIRAAVELFAEKGFGLATMREISSRAGYGAATIYNYFPTKESIFYAYLDEKQVELAKLLDEIEGFGEFSFKEKLQTQIETLLEIYLPDREFVRLAFDAILNSPLKTFTELKPMKEKFIAHTRVFFAEATANNEIPVQPFENFLVNLYWDYATMIVIYWLRDESPHFDNTSRLVDLSLDLFVDIIGSAMITKTVDLFSFMVRSHLFGNIDKLFGLFSLLGKFQPGTGSHNAGSATDVE